MACVKYSPLYASSQSQNNCAETKVIVIGHIYSVIERHYKSINGVDKVLRFPKVLNQLAEQIRQEHADAIIFTGDLTQYGTQQEFDVLNKFIAEINTPAYFVPGNHDVASLDRKDTYLANIGYLSKVVKIKGHSIFLLDSASTATNKFTARIGGGLSSQSYDLLTQGYRQKNYCIQMAAMHQTIFDSRIWERDTLGVYKIGPLPPPDLHPDDAVPAGRIIAEEWNNKAKKLFEGNNIRYIFTGDYHSKRPSVLVTKSYTAFNTGFHFIESDSHIGKPDLALSYFVLYLSSNVIGYLRRLGEK